MKKTLTLYLINAIVLTILSFSIIQPSMKQEWESLLYSLAFLVIIILTFYFNRKLLKLKYSILLTLSEWFIATFIINQFHILYKIKNAWENCNTDIFRILLVFTLSVTISIIVFALRPKSNIAT